MHLITHRKHITPDIPVDLTEFIIKRFEQLAEETDVPPIIILVELGDDIKGSDYAFIGNQGLLSDAYEEHTPGEAGFIRPYEWVSYWPDLQLYEILFLRNYDDGHFILISTENVNKHPDLKWVLTDESQGGLSEPQPLY